MSNPPEDPFSDRAIQERDRIWQDFMAENDQLLAEIEEDERKENKP